MNWTFTATPDPGDWEIEYGVHPSGSTSTVTVFLAHHRSRTISGLTNSTTYRFRVRGITANVTQWSGWVTATPQAATPDAPTGLTVTPGDAQLSVSWTAPSGTVTGYDVHYTSNTTVAAGAAVQAGAASVGWKAVSRSGTTASQAISSLMNGTTYRVRVRAKNTGDSAWVHSSGTPSASAATAIWSATLTVKSVGASNRGCDNTNSGNECSSTSVLTDDDFTLSGTTWTINSIHDTSSKLEVEFSGDVRTALDSYSFCVGATAFAFSSASHVLSTLAVFSTTAVNWNVGDTVALSINSASCAQQAVQAPPTDLAVTPGDAELTVSWTAPSNVDDISGYEIDFTSAAVGDVADDAASSGADPAVAWVATSQINYTATSFAIDSDEATLTNGVTYRVRLRTVGPDSAYVYSSGTPSASAATAIWSATLTAQRIVSSFRGCDNTGAGGGEVFGGRDADRRRLHALEHGLGDNGNTKRWLAHDRLFQPGRADRAGQLQLLRRRDGICVLGRDSRGGQ